MSQARLFVSYSHKDEAWLELVRTHLATLHRQGLLFAWSDKDIRPGDAWQEEIEIAISEADVAVLLVSPNFLASDFIIREELPRLLAIKRGEQPGRLRRIMPLILKPCLWSEVPALSELEVRPKGRELSAGSEHQQNADLAEFAAFVSQILFQTAKPREIESAGVSLRHVVVGEKAYATLEVRLSHCEWNSYGVELSFTWSGDRASDFVRRYRICLDLGRFDEIDDPDIYGGELRRAVFPHDGACGDVIGAQMLANDKKVPLRLRICIEPSARELHALSWEKLTLGSGSDNPLSPKSIALARYALGYGVSSRAALSRREDEPRALLLGVAEDRAAQGSSAPVTDPIAKLLSRAGIACTIIAEWLDPGKLEEVLRGCDGVDYIYLLIKDGTGPKGRGMSGALSYEDAWDADPVCKGLVEAMNTMERPPRLMMIVPAGVDHPGQTQNWPWLVHLAHESVERGVLCVLTLQDALSDDDWQTFLQTFFGGIIQHDDAIAGSIAVCAACALRHESVSPTVRINE